MRLTRNQPDTDPGLLLLRSVCHELRPPMATLTSLVRALENEPPEPRRSQLARLAIEHATHAQTVLGQAAAAANGLAGEVPPAVPLGDVLPTVAATAPAGRLTVHSTRSAAGWLVHSQHTRQILINLIGNAVRYTRGPIRLTARLRARRLRLTVTDRGGPTAELISALQRRTPPPDDNGLGLWLVRQLATECRGTLRAKALSPVGLAMELTLPRVRS